MSFWEWVRTHLLLLLPLINLILLIYWACSETGKASRRNFARAYLFVMVLGIVLVGLLAGLSVPLFQKLRDHSRARMEELAQKRNASGSAEEGGATANAASDESPPPAKPPTIPAGEEPMRTFRSTDGRTIQARVVSVTDEQVTIRRADGQEFTTEMTRFSPEDVEYFMRLRHGGGAFD